MTLRIGFVNETVDDGDKLFFGSDRDYSVTYDPNTDSLNVVREDSGTDSLTVDGTDIVVEGTVNASDPNSLGDLTTKSYVDNRVNGLFYQESVIDEQNTPPSSPTDGDRYLVNDSPTGDWSGQANDIAEWEGSSSSWTFGDPSEGWAVFLEDIDVLKTFSGSDWVQFGSTIAHDTLIGLGDDDHTQYLHEDGRRAASGTLTLNGTPSLDAANGADVAGTVNANGSPAISLGGNVEDGSGNIVYDNAASQIPTVRLAADTDEDGTIEDIEVPSKFVEDGDGLDRDIWVIDNGASDPVGADSNDIIFERE
jgi:hypothetical protein